MRSLSSPSPQRIVRNFISLKTLPPRPARSCEKNIGLPIVQRTASATTAISGIHSGAVARTSNMSSVRFMTVLYHNMAVASGQMVFSQMCDAQEGIDFGIIVATNCISTDMGILGVILFWGIIILIWRLQGGAAVWHKAGENQAHGDYIQDVMLASLGKMFALMSKADGRISKREVDTASRCLRSLGLTECEYQKCVTSFNSVHSPSKDLFRRCASDYAAIVRSDACILLYEMLWKVASVDGVLDASEDELLRMAVDPLKIDPSFYQYFKRMHFRMGGSTGNQSVHSDDSRMRDAYAKLGCSLSDSDETLRAAYRKLAMRYHPDRLKAEGVPDSMVAIATRSMSEINAAWELIKRERKCAV